MTEPLCSARILTDVVTPAVQIAGILEYDREKIGKDPEITNQFMDFTNSMINGLAQAGRGEISCNTTYTLIEKLKYLTYSSIKMASGSFYASRSLRRISKYPYIKLGDSLYLNGFHHVANQAWSITFSTEVWPLPFSITSEVVQSESTPAEIASIDYQIEDKSAPAAIGSIEGPNENKSALRGLRKKLNREERELLIITTLIHHFDFRNGIIRNPCPISLDRLVDLMNGMIPRSTCHKDVQNLFRRNGSFQGRGNLINELLTKNSSELAKILKKHSEPRTQSLSCSDLKINPEKLPESRSTSWIRQNADNDSKSNDKAAKHLNHYSYGGDDLIDDDDLSE